MDISEKQYKIVFTNDCIQEMDDIYNYISKKLYSSNSAKSLMKKIDDTINDLKIMPEKYFVIKKYDELNLEYRRIVVNKYIILYTISEQNNTIYIVHMYYAGENYLDKI